MSHRLFWHDGVSSCRRRRLMVRLDSLDVQTFANIVPEFDGDITINVDAGNRVRSIPTFAQFRPLMSLLQNLLACLIIVGVSLVVGATQVFINGQLSTLANGKKVSNNGHI